MSDEPKPADSADDKNPSSGPYEPPTAEDVDTTHAPSESVPGVVDVSPKR
jgi:hypothetical protein